MRGITILYCLECEHEGCLANSEFVEMCKALDLSEECPTHLDFRMNYLGDAGAAAIIRTVAIMRWVRVVDMRGSGAGAKAVRALADIAGEHPNLRLVDLRGEKNDVFAMSCRLILDALRRCPKLVVRVNCSDLPPTMARRLRESNRRNRLLQLEEEAAAEETKLAAMPALGSLEAAGHDKDLFYLPICDPNGSPLYANDANMLQLVESINTYMEDYLEGYHYVGSVAAQLAVDLGAAILPCIRATAVAAFPSVATPTGHVYPHNVRAAVRAVDALLGGLCANPFLLEELLKSRGTILEMYVYKLKELRGEYESLVASRVGTFPSRREKMLVAQMRPLYARIVAGIVQKSMTDLPSMRHVEEHLQDLRRVLLDKLLEGKERVLPLLLAQVRYFGYNNRAQTMAWAESYLKNLEQPLSDEDCEVSSHCDNDDNAETKTSNNKTDEVDEKNMDDDDWTDDDILDSVPKTQPQPVKMCVKAICELRAMLNEPYTAARYAVTRPLFEALPMELRLFLCDLALRRAASLYSPVVFALEKGEKLGEGEGEKEANSFRHEHPESALADPFDIVRIFERICGRKDFSEVLCAFEEWYRLRQVECYEVTYVSRQVLLSLMSSM